MKSNSKGFTLLELSMAMAISSMLILAMAGILNRSIDTWEQEEDHAMVNQSLRVAEMDIRNALMTASLLGDVTQAPPVQAVTLNANPGTAVTMQRPLAIDGTAWTNPITIRLRNEDINGNLLLDGGEDVDNDGALNRVVERLEDINNDGDFNDNGETRTLSTNVDALTFTLNGSIMTVTMLSRRPIDDGANVIATDNLAFTVPILN